GRRAGGGRGGWGGGSRSGRGRGWGWAGGLVAAGSGPGEQSWGGWPPRPAGRVRIYRMPNSSRIRFAVGQAVAQHGPTAEAVLVGCPCPTATSASVLAGLLPNTSPRRPRGWGGGLLFAGGCWATHPGCWPLSPLCAVLLVGLRARVGGAVGQQVLGKHVSAGGACW